MLSLGGINMGGESKEGRRPEASSRKVDVSKLVSIIPPPSELKKREEKKIIEKRIRIRYDESLPEGVARLSKELASYLGINENDLIEIVVGGKRKFVFKTVIDEKVEANTVYCYPEELRERGVADYSIATVRKRLQQGYSS